MHADYLTTWLLISIALGFIFLIILACRRLLKPKLFSKIMYIFLVVVGPWFMLGLVLGMIDLSSDFTQTSEFAVPVNRQPSLGKSITGSSIFALVPLFTVGSLGIIIDILLLRGALKKRRASVSTQPTQTNKK